MNRPYAAQAANPHNVPRGVIHREQHAEDGQESKYPGLQTAQRTELIRDVMILQERQVVGVFLVYGGSDYRIRFSL